MTQAAEAGELDAAFPTVECGIEPFGSRVVLQVRTPKSATKSGIILPDEARETEKWNTQIAKVIAVGPLAYKSRDTMKSWPEGSWAKPGEFVRVAKYGGDRWEVPIPGTKDKAVFVLLDDLSLLGRVTANPLEVLAYI